MPKFFVTNQPENNIIRITGSDAFHITCVLKYKDGETIVACDPDGTDYSCRIVSCSEELVVLDVLESSQSQTEPSYNITLFQGLPKGDKMDLIIQKCVELGISQIVPVETERSVAKINDKSNAKRLRYQKISESAAKQSLRGSIPIIADFCGLKQALKIAAQLDACFVAYENENEMTIKDFIRKCIHGNGKKIGFFIGPEGGFSHNEMTLFKSNGIGAVTLGKRILRTETAGFFSLILLLHELEEF